MKSITYLTCLCFLTALLSPCLGKECLRVVKLNPPGLFNGAPFGFSQLSVDTRAFTAHISGQIAVNATGSVVGTTLPEQLAQIQRNLRAAMRFLGAQNKNIIRIRAFIKDFDPINDIEPYREVARSLGSPVATVVGVTAHALPPLMAEIDMDVSVGKKRVRQLRCM